MSDHARISLATDLDIYFCDPHSPWQRGSNENTNGLLRQYFPKGTDLSGYHPDYLDYVAAQLNDRPRKRHNWQTPREVLTTLLDNPTPPNCCHHHLNPPHFGGASLNSCWPPVDSPPSDAKSTPWSSWEPLRGAFAISWHLSPHGPAALSDGRVPPRSR